MFHPRFSLAFSVWLCGLSASAQTQDNIEFPAASPAATLQQRIGLTDFEITYSRPSVKGRTIFGSLQSFGEVWRTGANAATKLTFDTEILFGGQAVPAGTYALFTIPGETSWTVILNQDAEQWGAFRYDASVDIVRVTAEPEQAAPFRETLVITFDRLRDESADLVIGWENTEVRVPITVDVVTRLKPQIEEVMATGESQPDYLYYQAANFYFEHREKLGEEKLDSAAAWIGFALEENPDAYWMLHLQAKILAELGLTESAIESAQRSTAAAVAQEGPNSGYRVLNDAIIARLRE